MKYDANYDETKVIIAGWEYSVMGEEVNFTPTKPTHAVYWMRPTFVLIDKIPEGFALVDAYECWPPGVNQVVDQSGHVITRPRRGTWVLAPLPKEFGEK